LARAIDKNVADHKGDKRAGFIVLLIDNDAGNREKVAAFAKEHAISIPMTIALEGSRGPRAYRLHADVPITVLAYERKTVKANFALVAAAPSDEAAQAKEVADILAAADKALE